MRSFFSGINNTDLTPLPLTHSPRTCAIDDLGLDGQNRWCEFPTMNTTKVRPKNQVTLPTAVLESAGVGVDDLVEWRFEGGEIRGARMEKAKTRTIVHRPKLVRRRGLLVFDVPFEIPPEAFAAAVREEREEQ